MSDIRTHVPDYYDNVAEMTELIDAEDIELDKLNARSARTFLNMYVVNVDPEGATILEAQYHITYDVLPSLETRRYNLIMRLLPPRPITIRYFKQLLTSIAITADIDVDAVASTFVMYLDSDLVRPGQIDQVINLMRVYLPAHLANKVYNLYHRKSNLDRIIGTANNLVVNDNTFNKDDIYRLRSSTNEFLSLFTATKIIASSFTKDDVTYVSNLNRYVGTAYSLWAESFSRCFDNVKSLSTTNNRSIIARHQMRIKATSYNKDKLGDDK